MDPVLKTLVEARDLIADPGHWTQRTSARDIFGQPVVSLGYENAVSYCLLGAVDAIAQDTVLYNKVTDYLAEIRRKNTDARDPRNLSGFNDVSEHADVIDLFDQAIANRRKESV